MAKSEKVERPTKKSEYELRFASVQAKRGWADLKATIRNSLVDSWDFLTRTPQVTTPTNSDCVVIWAACHEAALLTKDGSTSPP
jgi:hypothetical protein